MYQLTVTILDCTSIAEECLPYFVAIDSKRLMLGTVCAEASTILVLVYALQWLVHIPDTTIAIILFIVCNALLRERTR